MRSKNQTLWDYSATLRLFEAVNKVDWVDGNLKIQKLSFIAELKGIQEGIAATHFKFFRYNLGPYSKDLANDVKKLIEFGLITTTHRLTKKGVFILEYIGPAVKQSESATKAVEIIESAARTYGKKTGPQLKDLVYKLKVPVYQLDNEVQRVEDIELFTDIFNPTQTDGLKETSPFSEDMIEAIEQELDLPLDTLDPNHIEYQRTIESALCRIKHAVSV
jgi:uncharacterized protein YwgA